MSVILLDCDGVVADFVGCALEVLHEETGRDWKRSDVTEWGFDSILATMNELHVRRFWGAFRMPGVANGLDMFPGSVEGVKLLTDAGHTVVWVTAPMAGSPTWAFERACWLEDRWPGMPVVSTQHKAFIRGDFMVDDKPANLLERHGGGSVWHGGMLWDAPYNASAGMVRVFDWFDVLNFVEGVQLARVPA